MIRGVLVRGKLKQTLGYYIMHIFILVTILILESFDRQKLLLSIWAFDKPMATILLKRSTEYHILCNGCNKHA